MRPERFELPTFWLVAIAAHKINEFDGQRPRAPNCTQVYMNKRVTRTSPTIGHTQSGSKWLTMQRVTIAVTKPRLTISALFV